MLDIKFLRENPEIVKQNIKNKFQDKKLPLVDEVIQFDKERRETQQKADELRAQRKKNSKMIGALMGQGKKEEAEAMKAEVAKNAEELAALERLESELADKVNERMLVIPNIIDSSVPIGKDDSENVELEKFGEPVVPDFEIPYHTDIMDKFEGDRFGRCPGCSRQRFLLSDGGYCTASFCRHIICKRFYDRTWFCILCAAVYDSLQCCNGGYVI